jgi:hypothetical protein
VVFFVCSRAKSIFNLPMMAIGKVAVIQIAVIWTTPSSHQKGFHRSCRSWDEHLDLKRPL